MEWKILAASGILAAVGSFCWSFWRECRLKRRHREQTLFYAMLGHELKTPLNGIVEFADLLQSAETTPEEQQEYARDIRLSATRMLTLINNILDCAKLHAGQLQIHPRLSDLAEIVSELGLLLTPLMAEKNLRLTIDLPAVLPLLCVDPERIRQILRNLIGNAIQFSDNGVIVVEVRWEPADNSRGCLTLRVSDQGQGIPPEYRKRIFEPFVQQKQHSVAGTGLGLFITLQLIERMNGAIGLESEVGKGSCFTVTFPKVVYD